MESKLLYLIQYSSNKIRLDSESIANEVKIVKELAECLYNNKNSDNPIIQDILDMIGGTGAEFWCDEFEKEELANRLLEIYT